MRCRGGPTALCLLAALLLGACGGDDGDSAASSTTVGAVTTVPALTVPAPTSTAAPGTTKPGCADPAPEPGATDVTSGQADVNGDGRTDTVEVYRTGPPDEIASWHLRAELGGGGGADLVLQGDEPGPAAVALVGPARVNGDASDEIWLRVGSGASTTLLGLFVFRACQLEAATLGGLQAVFAVGGGVRFRSGLECTDAGLAVYEAEGEGSPAYTGTTTVHRLNGATLTAGDGEPLSYNVADPASGRYGTFTCGALTL
ncbi:MAG: hypothetical protein ABR540_06055 [Acidimicrobiales bacterium]